MDYNQIYHHLCVRGQQPRTHKCYTEKHHIVPKCLGGSNREDNITILTAREHFIAHRLLTKIYNIPKMWYALFNMTIHQPTGQRICVSSRTYSYIREETAKVRRSPEQRKLAANKSKGNTNVRGKKWWYNKESDTYVRSIEPPDQTWINQGKPSSDLQKEIVKQIMTNRIVTENTKQKLSLKAKQRTHTNNKGTIWVIDNQGKRKRVFPNHIPEGFIPVNKHKEL